MSETVVNCTAVREVADLAAKANELSVFTLEGVRGKIGIYDHLAQDDQSRVRIMDQDYPIEKHTMEDPVDMPKLLDLYPNHDRYVYYGLDGFRVWMRRSHEVVEFKSRLSLSNQARMLVDINGSKFSQEEFIDFIQWGWSGCVVNSDKWLATLRNVKFDLIAKTDEKIDHTRRSLGVDTGIEISSSNGNGFPDLLELRIPIYLTAIGMDQRYLIKLRVDVDLAERRFELRMYPDEYYRAARKAVWDLFKEIDEAYDDVVIVYGHH